MSLGLYGEKPLTDHLRYGMVKFSRVNRRKEVSTMANVMMQY
jgi:hypothetical protein